VVSQPYFLGTLGCNAIDFGPCLWLRRRNRAKIVIEFVLIQ
jgi:hypothetical protein